MIHFNTNKLNFDKSIENQSINMGRLRINNHFKMIIYIKILSKNNKLYINKISNSYIFVNICIIYSKILD